MSIFDISIIIPVYNTGKLVEKCLLPLLKLDDDSLEVICVNDGSKDDSLEILREINEQFPKMKIINKENGGLSSARNSARNCGLEVATGKYIFFLDSDDWLDIESFLSLKDYCKGDYDIIHGNFNYTYEDQDPIKNKPQYEVEGDDWLDIESFLSLKDYCKGDYDIIHGNFNYTYEDQDPIKNKPQYEVEGVSGQEFLNKALLTNQFSIPVCINLYKRSFLQDNQLKFMEGIFHEDEEFNIKAFSLANKVASKNIYFYQYFQRPNSITNNASNTEKRFLDILKIANEVQSYCRVHDFDSSFNKVIDTYMSLVIISGYIRIRDPKIANKYYSKVKSMKLYQSITPFKLEFLVLRIMLKYCPRLFFTVYRLYFDLTSKKV